MPALRPFTILADAARRALRIVTLILGRIGAVRRRRAAEDRTLAALAERFPDAPEHWLRFIAERAPALAGAGETGAPRMSDIAAAPEPRRLPSPVGPRAVPDRVAPAGEPAVPAAVSPGRAPVAGQRPRMPRLRLEPTRQEQAEAPPIRPKARGLIRVLDPAGRRPQLAIGTGRAAPAPSSPGATEPSPPPPTTHATRTGEAQEQVALPRPEWSHPIGGFRRLARHIAGGLRAAATVLQRSRPERNADPQDGRGGPKSLFLVADERSGRGLDAASAGHPATSQRWPQASDTVGTAGQGVSDRPGNRAAEIAPRRHGPPGLAIASAAASNAPAEGWPVVMPAGRRPEPAAEPTPSRRAEAIHPARPDWPSLPWTEPARIGDAPVDPPRLVRLRQEQEVGLWSA